MGQNSSAAAGVAPSSSVGVVGRSHMAEVQAEDENLAYRRGVKLLDTDDRREIDRRVTERLRFCCEEEWKDYLRCMEGRALSQNPECFPIKEKANVCVERLNRAQITATSEKRHVMNILQGEARIRSAINMTEWVQRPDLPDVVEENSASAEAPLSQALVQK